MPATAKRRPVAQSHKGNSVSVEESIPLGKYLASTEKKIRDGAIKSLANFLAQSNREPLNDEEMAKLWKGIFYCFWMSDKPRVQQALAQELADLLLIIKSPSSSTSSSTKPALLFLEGFFDAMVREWPGLDKWRIDKFYLLFRRFVNAAFRLLARHGWEEQDLSQFTESLTKQGGPLCPNDIKVPDGITYHLADVYLEELERAAGTVDEEEKNSNKSEKIPLLKLLQPFISTTATCYSPLVYDRIANEVINPLLKDCLALEEEESTKSERKRKSTSQKGSSKRKSKKAEAEVSEEESSDEEEDSTCQFANLMEQTGIPGADLRKAIFDAIFQTASRNDSIDARRRRLYKLCKDEEDRLEDEE